LDIAEVFWLGELVEYIRQVDALEPRVKGKNYLLDNLNCLKSGLEKNNLAPEVQDEISEWIKKLDKYTKSRKITAGDAKELSEKASNWGKRIQELIKHHYPQRGMLKEKTVLGARYELENLLGKGSYGEVWKCTDKSLGRTVAVKILYGGIKDLEHLKSEGQALSALSHKNIVTVHDLGSNKTNGWLVMEFVDGRSLCEYLEDLAKEGEWLPFDEARDIVQQVLEALEFAHEKNRVHGDIKPANIFVPKTGEIKLGDFGVAKILGNTDEEKKEYPPEYERRLGSPSYVAPEILNGQPRDVQSDLFAVGTLAYILFTGQHPFMHRSGFISIPELIRSEKYRPPKPRELNEEIPEKYEKIVMHLLEKDRDKRYKKAREVLDEWREKTITIQCPSCNAENPISNQFCGQCGNNLSATIEAELEPEEAFRTSFALFRSGLSGEAITIMRKSLDAKPDFAKGWTHLGYMLNYERRYDEAEAACTLSINLDPEPSSPYQTRGFARSNLGRYPEAIDDFTKALEKEKDERRQSRILHQRGYARRLSGDREGALKDVIEALELDPTNTKALVLRSQLEIWAA